MGRQCQSVFPGDQQSVLDVSMSLHQTRYKVVTTHIHLTGTAVGAAGASTGYVPPGYCYIGFIDLVGEDIDQLGIFEDQVGGTLPASDFD
jgi:hypothetical protein